jgi:hypothetical protein
MKKIVLVIVVALLLQVAAVSVSQAAPPADGPMGRGYQGWQGNYGHGGWQGKYGQGNYGWQGNYGGRGYYNSDYYGQGYYGRYYNNWSNQYGRGYTYCPPAGYGKWGPFQGYYNTYPRGTHNYGYW